MTATRTRVSGVIKTAVIAGIASAGVIGLSYLGFTVDFGASGDAWEKEQMAIIKEARNMQDAEYKCFMGGRKNISGTRYCTFGGTILSASAVMLDNVSRIKVNGLPKPPLSGGFQTDGSYVVYTDQCLAGVAGCAVNTCPVGTSKRNVRQQGSQVCALYTYPKSDFPNPLPADFGSRIGLLPYSSDKKQWVLGYPATRYVDAMGLGINHDASKNGFIEFINKKLSVNWNDKKQVADRKERIRKEICKGIGGCGNGDITVTVDFDENAPYFAYTDVKTGFLDFGRPPKFSAALKLLVPSRNMHIKIHIDCPGICPNTNIESQTEVLGGHIMNRGITIGSTAMKLVLKPTKDLKSYVIDAGASEIGATPVTARVERCVNVLDGQECDDYSKETAGYIQESIGGVILEMLNEIKL